MFAEDSSVGLARFLEKHVTVAKPVALSVGLRLGPWTVSAFIGRGGSAEVYQVRNLDGTDAALKVLVDEDPALRQRFAQETELLARGLSPVLPRFYDSGERRGHSYFVCELLEPVEVPRNARAVAKYLIDVCNAVEVLHGLGLVHRDLKPSNVMRRADGRLVLIDLGLAKDLSRNRYPERNVTIVSEGIFAVGTLAFAAPEQLRGGRITPLVDIHAIGMIANSLLGENPSRGWAAVIRRATCSIPELRYHSAAEMAAAIRRLIHRDF